jgi:hypothetical protein
MYFSVCLQQANVVGKQSKMNYIIIIIVTGIIIVNNLYLNLDNIN